MILLLAIRNILRNRRSSALLILLMAFITLIFFLGSSLILQSVRGLRSTYVDNLTGDLVIQKESRVSMNLFGANTPVIDDFFTIPVLPAYDEVQQIIRETLPSAQISGMVSGQAVLDIGGDRAGIPLMGVDAEHYFALFPGLKLVKGSLLEPEEQGVLITESRARSIETKTGQTVQIGQPARLTAAGVTGFKIREVPIRGIIRYTNPGPFMEEVVITDPQTVRALSSVLTEAAEEVDVEDDALELLNNDMDDLFGSGDDSFFEDVETNDATQVNLIDSLREELTAENNPDIPWVGGDWNFIIIRLPQEDSALLARNRLNSRLEPYGVKAVGWQTAAGNSALLVLLVQNLFYIGIILVGIAGVVTIVNIILISVFRRTREIGTLRAIGASDAYIMGMLGVENLALSLVGGGTGVLLGQNVMNSINRVEWPIPHPFIAALMGSPVLQISVLPDLALKAVAVAVLIGFVSALFPALKAVNINPMEAVRQG